MADKFIDHGAYHYNASFTASISGSVLIVTAVASGKLGVGALIAAPGLGAEFRISGMGTATGGTGNYTLSKSTTLASTTMTAIGGMPAPTLIPAWGMPEDGDGTTSDASLCRSATVSIDLAAATAAAGATISILGATLTCVASGAGNNQFNAGAGATLVANLVAAINRAANTVTIAAQATGWQTPKIQDAVFARVGTPTTTLEIMTRAGSATYNGKLVATSGLTGGTFGPYAFSGGVGGPWGYLVAHWSPVFPSGITDGRYGLWQGVQLAGQPRDATGAGDRVYVRAGKDIHAEWPNTPFPTIRGDTMQSGTAAAPVVYVVDDGTVWPADGLNPVLQIAPQIVGGTWQPSSVMSRENTHIILRGKTYADGTKSLRIRAPAYWTGGSQGFVLCGGFSFHHAEFSAAAPGSAVVFRPSYLNATATNAISRVSQCLIRHGVASFEFIRFDSFNGGVEFVGCEFSGAGMSSPMAAFFHSNVGSSINAEAEALFEACRWTNFPVGSRLFSSGQTVDNKLNLTFSNCDMGNVTVRGQLTSQTPRGLRTRRIVGGSSQFGSRDWFIDTPTGCCDWTAAAGFPTLNARLMDGVTPWSMRITPPTLAAAVSRIAPLESPRIGKFNTLGTTKLLLTVELAIEQGQSWTTSDVSLNIVYQDSTGTLVYVDTWEPVGTALEASSATWSSEVSGQVAFYPGPVLHNKRKITFTTPTPVAANSEVGVFVRIHTNVSDTTKTVFVDPEITLQAVP